MAKKNNCDDCFYYRSANLDRYCAYIFVEHKRRPCPPGDECTVKIRRKVNRRKKVKADEDC